MIADGVGVEQVDLLQRYLLGSFTLEYHDHCCDTPSFIGEKLKVHIDKPTIEITVSKNNISGKVKTGSLNVVLINSQGKYFTDIDHFYSEIWNFLDDYVEICAEVIDFANLLYKVRFDVYLRGSVFKIKYQEDLPFRNLLREENAQLSLIREQFRRKEIQKYALEAFLMLRDLLDVKLDTEALIRTDSRFLDDLILQKYREKYQKIHERQDIVKNLRIPNVIDGACRFTEESVEDFRAQLPNNDEFVQRIRVRQPIYKQLQIGEERALKYKLADDPQGLKCQLRDFQKQGLNWMLYREGYITEKELNHTVTNPDRNLHPNWSAFEVEGKTVYFNEMNGQFSQMLPPMLRVKGGILADEMGLGKSVQSIALILATKNQSQQIQNQQGQCGTLLIVQKSTLGHWENLFKQHIEKKTLDILEYYESYIRNDNRLDLTVYDVVISTYDVVGIDHEKNGTLFKQKWRRVILDEAHQIKGRDNRCSRACFNLNTEVRWCLTGTPLQNNLTELFSLFHFLKVDTFSDFHWFNNYIIKPEDQRKVYSTIHQILQPIMLRRTKASKDLNGNPIIVLPEKQIKTIWVQLDPEERIIYDTWFQKSSQKFKELLTSKKSVKVSTVHILAQLSFLRQICDNPMIFLKKAQQKLKKTLQQKIQQPSIDKIFEGFFKQQDNECSKQLFSELKAGAISSNCLGCFEPMADDIVVFECAHVWCKNCSDKWQKGCPICRDGNLRKKNLTKNEEKLRQKQEKRDKKLQIAPIFNEQIKHKETSSKMLAVLRELELLSKQNQKVVIFTQFKCILNHLQSLLMMNKYRFCRLDGDQTNQERTENIEKFQSGNYQVFLASLKAGSLGIDLTVANNVFIVDPWWNPSVENQASDRVHRFNQNKSVQIYHFICEKTIEERVLQIQDQKAQIIGKTLSDADLDSVLSFKERLELIFN